MFKTILFTHGVCCIALNLNTTADDNVATTVKIYIFNIIFYLCHKV